MEETVHTKNIQTLKDYLSSVRTNARVMHTIVIHCSATKAGKDFRKDDIERWHRERGFKECGYHFIIDLDGTVEIGRSIEKIGAHVKNHNIGTVGICYIGGLDAAGKPADTRTPDQKTAMAQLIWILHQRIPSLVHIKGHRDYSPDLDGDGTIQEDEWMKACPCFDVKEWIESGCE